MIKETFKNNRGWTSLCVCEICGKEFYKAHVKAKKSKRHYCSLECFYSTFPESKKIKLICDCCKKEFEIDKEQVDRRKKEKHFCSSLCNLNYCIENKIPVNNPAWRGLRVIDINGYASIYVPELSQEKMVYAKEHRVVMEKLLGRPLKKGENVHHKNGIRDDNRIENLELWSSAHPSGQRVEDKIQWAIWFLSQYGYETIKMDSYIKQPEDYSERLENAPL